MEPLEPVIWDALRELRQTRGLPLITKQMVWLHMTKPWVHNFRAVLIAPARSDPAESRALRSMLGPELGPFQGINWYYPSREWWMAHAHTSHPPDGGGCDEQAHVQFLTPEGAQTQEFHYANLLHGGELRVLGPEDFAAECAWWDSVFTRVPR